jgi:hypothetical protein
MRRAGGAAVTGPTEATEAIAQEIWQAYVVEVGRSLPPGLADKMARAVVGVLTTNGWALTKLPEPQWQNSTGTSWQVSLDGEIEDVYRRGDDITISGIEMFAAEDIPALAAALLAAAVSPTQKEPGQ